MIRELRTPDEFIETTHVSKAAWGFADRVLSPASDLIAATHAGGLTAGAFEGGQMLGFVHGIPRTNLGEPCHHSHLLAVRPEAQGRGLSVKLKLFQRAWCLARGHPARDVDVRPVPPEEREAEHRAAPRDRPELPARTSTGSWAGSTPTSRPTGSRSTWRLDDPAVGARRAGEARPPSGRRSGRAAWRGARGRFPTRRASSSRSRRARPRIYRTDHDGTLRARRRFAALGEGALRARLRGHGRRRRRGRRARVRPRRGAEPL